MKDSFVFFRGFLNTISLSPDRTEQNQILRYLVDCALENIEVSDVPYPYNMAIDQMMVSVDRSHQRYENAVDTGKTGGRPKKWVDEETAKNLFSSLGSWDAVAKEMGVSRDTLRKARFLWESRTPKNDEKPKNPSYTLSLSDSYSYSESKSVSLSDLDERIINKNNINVDEATDANASPHAVEKKESDRDDSSKAIDMLLQSGRKQKEQQKEQADADGEHRSNSS